MGCEPIVLANLCVTYILSKQNLKAEELIQTIATLSDSAHSMHLCIVNLVMGTLYGSKGNYEFGARLVIRALDPVQDTIGTDTWLYAKRCLLSLFEKLVTNTQVPLD